MAYGTINAGTIEPGSGNTLTINQTVDGTAIKDQDNMSSNSATHLATQQSIKAYTDALKTNESITTLGTVTAGNLSNTAIVYPAGHILQVQYMSYNGVTQNSTGAYTNVLGSSYVTITKKANTNLFIHWSSQFGKNGNVYLNGTKIQRATDTGFSANLTDLPASPQVATTTYPYGDAIYNAESGYLYIGTMGHTTIDTSLTATAGTFYFRAQFKGNGATVYSKSDNGVAIMYVMEIVA